MSQIEDRKTQRNREKERLDALRQEVTQRERAASRSSRRTSPSSQGTNACRWKNAPPTTVAEAEVPDDMAASSLWGRRRRAPSGRRPARRAGPWRWKCSSSWSAAARPTTEASTRARTTSREDAGELNLCSAARQWRGVGPSPGGGSAHPLAAAGRRRRPGATGAQCRPPTTPNLAEPPSRARAN